MNKPPLRSLDEALSALLGCAATVDGTERVSTLEAAGRVLAADLRSTIDVPPADNTQMDGYAVRVADFNGAVGARLRIAQRIPAGRIGVTLDPGTVARIFTGAFIPSGADAVVMQEQVRVDGEHAVFDHLPKPGEWIRRAGEDIAIGSVILPAGTRLTPQATGLAASVGVDSLDVRRRLKVACFFTGDELTMPGEPLRPGAIYNSNRFVLVGLLRALGCEVADFGIVPDSLEATRVTLRRAAAGADLIVTSGGVSVGDEDHVRPAVEAEGELALWQVAIKPGKPLAFGRVRRKAEAPADVAGATGTTGAVATAAPGALDHPGAWFIGLPGNPVSSFVTFLLLVRPFLLRLQGVNDVEPMRVAMRADFNWPRPDRRREFLRVSVNAGGGLDLFPNQSSGVLTSTVRCDGLVDNPPGRVITPGGTVRFIALTALGA